MFVGEGPKSCLQIRNGPVMGYIAPAFLSRIARLSTQFNSGCTAALRTPYSTLILTIQTCILVGMLVRNRLRRSRAAAPRDPERTRGRLLRAASQEIHRSGFRNADLDAILARAGVTKGALYYHFDNKEALGYAVVDEVIAGNLHQKWVQPLRNAKDPIAVLVRIIQSESLKREDVQ